MALPAINYDRINGDFRAACDAYGTAMTFTPRAGGTYTAKGFARSPRMAELIGGFEQRDLVVTVSAQGMPAQMPLKFDRWVINGQTYSVMHANSLMAGNVLMGYKVFVRGGM